MARIEISHVSKEYAGGVVAVDDVSLEIASGEFMVLVGPSGCGKSTLLRMIAGLEDISAGAVLIDGRDVTNFSPRQRDVAMVFQNYALYPHMTVRKNLGYGLRMRKVPRQEIGQRVLDVARMLGLEELLDRRPAQLSGGQRQRVAMGRAIVRRPQAFLMDEPLSNLDATLRVAMRAELARLHDQLGVTTVYVTHDQVEAMTLGQRVAVMRGGKIQQVATPQMLYHEPASALVAAFIGSPAMNLVRAVIDGHVVVFGGLRIPLDPERVPEGAGDVILGIRPHAFEDAASADATLPRITVTPSVLEELGSAVHVIFPVDAVPVRAEGDPNSTSVLHETRLVQDDDRARFTATVTPRTTARQGVPLALAVDPAQFHYFDPRTGLSLVRNRRPAATPVLSAGG